MAENKITRDIQMTFSNGETITQSVELEMTHFSGVLISSGGGESQSAGKTEQLTEIQALKKWLKKYMGKTEFIESGESIYLASQVVKVEFKKPAPEFAPRRGHNF